MSVKVRMVQKEISADTSRYRKESELTLHAKDSCLGHKKLFQIFSEADQVLFVVFGPSALSGRMFQNLLEIRWWESFLNIKCTKQPRQRK